MLVLKYSPLQLTLLATTITTLLHLVVATHAGLSTDEAHYALYGLHLDWSYFDHPPMVGWLQAIVLPFSQSDFAMRLMPSFFYVLTSLTLYKVSKDFYPQESNYLPFYSVLIFQSGFIFQLIGFALLPETPLLLFSLLTVWAFFKLLQSNNANYWFYIGTFIGLAALSKYTAITLAISAAIVLILEVKTQWYKKIPFYLAILIAIILISPILYWNFQHDWISFLYQLKHGTGAQHWLVSNWLFTYVFQMLSYSPLIFIGGLISTLLSFKHWKHLGTRLLLIFSLPVFILFSWNSGYVEALPHWTALFWMLTTPLTARWLIYYWQSRFVRIFVYANVIYSILLISLIFSQFLTPWIPLKQNQNFARDLQGWNNVRPQINKLLQTTPTKNTLFVPNWTLGSRLAWYLKPLEIKVIDSGIDQFDLWFGAPEKDESGYMIVPDYFLKDSATASAIKQFKHCSQAINLSQNSLVNETEFFYYQCDGFKP